jgi:hypothetical protein
LSEQSTLSRRVRAIVLIALAMILTWQVVTRSLAAHLALAAPETSLSLRANDPVALLNLADSRLNSARQGEQPAARTSKTALPGGPGTERPTNDGLRLWADLALKSLDKSVGHTRDVERPAGAVEPSRASGPDHETSNQVRMWTELALGNEPLNTRALRILAQIADGAGDEERVSRFMRAAAQGSIRESAAVYWLMRKSYENRDYATTIYSADALLRTRSQTMPYVLPTLVQLAQNKDSSDEFKKTLANNPPWRSAFFSALPRGVTDARTPLELLLAIKDTPTPPTTADLRDYLSVLIEHKLYELAYYAWLQFLPPEQLSSTGLLFNGSFEVTPSGLPFDWAIRPGAGVTIDILPRPDQDGRRALYIEFGQGRVEFNGVSQLIMLAPGTYQFKGQYKGELVGRRGLVWRVSCAGGKSELIGESVMTIGAAPRWKDIELSFTVPDTDCRVQHLRLVLDARMASEQLVSGSVWYDELQISRVP